MANVLIVGCGYVGSRLGELLVEQGDIVYGLRRNTKNLPKAFRPIRADVCLLDSFAQLPKEISQVVYCVSASSFDEESYRAAYVHGLQNTLRMLRQSECQIEKMLYVSSTGVYGQDDGQEVNEESETEPARFSGRVLLDGEDRALRTSFPTTIVRFSGIYGPGRTSLLKDIKSARASCYLGLPHTTNRIHLEDCAGILKFLLSYNGVLEPVYIGSDDEPVDRAALLRYLAGCLNVDAPPLVSANDAPPRLKGKNKRCSNERIKSLGYEFIYPSYRQGYLELCAQMAEE